MKKLNITKEQFNRSRYFQRKYGRLEYVSESGKLFKTNKGKVLKFNESADQTLEDIIDNIVTLSILERDAESAEAMFQDLKQELYNMGLFNGQIDEDFDDFHDIAIDFAEHHNFNKQFVERAAVTLKSEIERGLSGTENMESTRRARRSARRFNESHLMNEMDSGFEGGVSKRGRIGKYDPGPSYDDVPHKTKKPKKGTKKPTPLTVGELLDIIEADNIPDDAIVCGGSFIGVRVADELTSEFSCYDEEKNRFELANLRAAQKELGF